MKTLKMFKDGRLVAVQDVTRWTQKEITDFVRVQHEMLGRTTKYQEEEG